MKLNILKLKIKLKSLAEEARIIRFHERKCGFGINDEQIRRNIREHRISVVRKESRDSNVAYAFLRGLSYRQVEPSAKTVPDLKNVLAIIERFRFWDSKLPNKQELKDWIDAPHQTEIALMLNPAKLEVA